MKLRDILQESLKKSEIHGILREWGLKRTFYRIEEDGSVTPTKYINGIERWGNYNSINVHTTFSKMPFKINMPEFENAELCFTNMGLETLENLPTRWNGYLDISGNNFTEVDRPLSAKMITCWDYDNKLKSLKNFPSKCDRIMLKAKHIEDVSSVSEIREFYLWDNELTSFQGFPKVTEMLYLGLFKKLESFKDCHKHLDVKRIVLSSNFNVTKGLLDLIRVSSLRSISMNRATDNKISSAIRIINKHLGEGMKGVVAAHRELVEHGLEELGES